LSVEASKARYRRFDLQKRRTHSNQNEMLAAQTDSEMGGLGQPFCEPVTSVSVLFPNKKCTDTGGAKVVAVAGWLWSVCRGS
jgi:hypothetical protein